MAEKGLVLLFIELFTQAFLYLIDLTRTTTLITICKLFNFTFELIYLRCKITAIFYKNK